mmetsp:Transcript_56554/g.157594  ORF Transcript_56554/g.157594 Transcript_56554/m.157594 type:complete len:217 (+) Transcript_56554:795-1445(+)
MPARDVRGVMRCSGGCRHHRHCSPTIAGGCSAHRRGGPEGVAASALGDHHSSTFWEVAASFGQCDSQAVDFAAGRFIVLDFLRSFAVGRSSADGKGRGSARFGAVSETSGFDGRVSTRYPDICVELCPGNFVFERPRASSTGAALRESNTAFPTVFLARAFRHEPVSKVARLGLRGVSRCSGVQRFTTPHGRPVHDVRANRLVLFFPTARGGCRRG